MSRQLHFYYLLVLLNLICANIVTQGGWEQYYHILPKMINKYGFNVGCEIGVAWGDHSYTILKNTNVSVLYSIDPWLTYDPGNYPADHSMHTWGDRGDVQYNEVKEKLSIFKDRSKLLRLTSVEAAKIFEDDSLDFIFIDAIHTYDALMEDLNAWYSKVKKGGVISGDDYTPELFLGLIEAVNEFFASKGLSINQDSGQPRFWWVHKN